MRLAAEKNPSSRDWETSTRGWPCGNRGGLVGAAAAAAELLVEHMMANAKLQKQALLPPRSPFPTTAPPPLPYAGDHGPISRPQGATHHRYGHGHGHGHHQRTSSESFIEEQPSWLDDLLDEPEMPVRQHGRAGHRRSSSDSFALFDGGAASGAYANGFEGIGGGQAAPWGGVQEYYAKPASFGRHQGQPWEQNMGNLVSYRQAGVH
ncbi:hypothetical protein GUJ93_ZPchr0047g2819 [Zizania palustris]|uniref:Uncharacterized protein n=1 Tax=Zizania palustris TaxID=103762 RepID=A0A8J5REW3_ZIZPA|nr:hypothetical protein GUJ93_ZPchr0047g2819 [Zizania palustris]